MCDPVSGTMATIAAASALTGTAASIMNEKARADALNSANLNNARLSIKEQLDLSNLDGIKQQQKRAALAENRLAIKNNAMTKGAQARASSRSVGAKESLEAKYARDEAKASGLMDSELDALASQSILARDSYESAANNRIGSLRSYKPSNMWLTGLDTSLQIGSGLLGAYKYGSKNNNK